MVLACFLSESTWALDHSITIPKWKALGPFVGGDAGVDHLLAYGGQEKILPSDDQVFYSALPDQGELHWFEVTTNKNGGVEIKYPHMNWDLFTKSFGLLSSATQGYAYAEIDFREPTTALLHLRSVAEVYLNGQEFFGESYDTDYTYVPVAFEKGKNRILLKLADFEDTGFEFKIEPATTEIKIPEDFTVSDISPDTDPDIPIGIPLINTTQSWLKNLKVVCEGDDYFERTETQLSFAIPPLTIMKFPIHCLQKASIEKSKTHQLKIQVLQGSKQMGSSRIPLRIRGLKDTHLVSFRSKIDNSIQYYSVLYPKNFDPAKKYALILALHGAHVPASYSIETYSPKDWAFVVAPENRRPEGFGYQEVGRLDVLEVLKLAEEKYPVDRDRIYLAGHSMGGQGAFHIGLHSPSLFAGLGPDAAWTSFQIYTPSYLQKSERLAPLDLLEFRNRVLADTNNPYFVKNALNLPVFGTQSDHDEVVPPFHERIFQEEMKNYGYQMGYREVHGNKHWCDTPLVEGKGYDCVDNAQQWNFLKAFSLNRYPKKIAFRLFDLSLENTAYWVTVDEQEKVFSSTEVLASVDGNKIELKTNNVASLSLRLPKELIRGKTVNVNWNGKLSQVELGEARVVHLGKTNSQSKWKKTPLQYGSLKSVFFHPYALVYGSKGSAEDSDILLHNARLLSSRIWRNANAMAPILSDREVTNDIIQKYNLVLFGGPERNSVTAKVMGNLPIRLKKNQILLGTHRLEAQSDAGLAAIVVYPNPLQPTKLIAVFGGTSSEAEKFSRYFRPLYDRLGVGVPDFVIFGKDVSRFGFAGVKSIGFFSKSWDLSNHDYYLNGEALNTAEN